MAEYLEGPKQVKGRQVVIGVEGSGNKRRIAVEWDDGSQGAYPLKAIDRYGCVSNNRMRLRNDDSEMEGRAHYVESSESDGDEAMSSDADLTETEIAETLEALTTNSTQKRTSIIVIRKRELTNIIYFVRMRLSICTCIGILIHTYVWVQLHVTVIIIAY